MIAAGRDELVCDLAETYGLFDWATVPVRTLATLAAGLREDSRVRLKLAGQSVPLDTLLLAGAVDRLSWLMWAQTEDARSGRGRPRAVTDLLLGSDPGGGEGAVAAFATAEEFEAAWAAGGGGSHGERH